MVHKTDDFGMMQLIHIYIRKFIGTSFQNHLGHTVVVYCYFHPTTRGLLFNHQVLTISYGTLLAESLTNDKITSEAKLATQS